MRQRLSELADDIGTLHGEHRVCARLPTPSWVTVAGAKAVFPAPKHCTDNGAMVAWAGLERFEHGLTNDPLVSDFSPRWPLGTVRPEKHQPGQEALSHLPPSMHQRGWAAGADADATSLIGSQELQDACNRAVALT